MSPVATAPPAPDTCQVCDHDACWLCERTLIRVLSGGPGLCPQCDVPWWDEFVAGIKAHVAAHALPNAVG